MPLRATQQFDVLILGHGLAGCTLARTLLDGGLHVAVIDDSQDNTASRIAAGLVTPITGPRLAITEHWEELWPIARDFYGQFESETGCEMFRERPAIRILANADEQAKFKERMESPEFRFMVNDKPELPKSVLTPHGAFAMQPAGQLDTLRFLSQGADRLRMEGRLIEARIEPDTDLDLEADPKLVTIPKLRVRAPRLVDCRGHASASTSWFNHFGWANARGEILTAEVPGLSETRSLHRGCWIAHAGGESYRLGATFDWKNLESAVTDSARETLLDRARQILDLPIHVTGQRAAVRPAIRDVHPVVGFLRSEPRIGILNGLGSKGVLLAPTLARVLADQLQSGTPIPTHWSVARWDR